MNFGEFVEKSRSYPFVRSHLFPFLSPQPAVLRRQVTDWIKKKWVLELKRSMYVIADPSRRCQASSLFLANYIHTPSYVSMETALSHYRLIPERIEAITSITSKKTKRYRNALGYFIYRHVKQSCYTLFVTAQDEFGRKYYIATPEKALVDYLYFHTHHLHKLSKDYFSASLRLQNVEQLSVVQLQSAVELFGQKKLTSIVKVLISYIEEQS